MYYLEWLKYFALILASGHIQMAESYKKRLCNPFGLCLDGFFRAIKKGEKK